jgi:hypothetical protein
MNGPVTYRPPNIILDPRIANELSRFGFEGRTIIGLDAAQVIDSPFDGYTRLLTARGGFMIHYQDQVRSWFLTALRIIAGLTAMTVIGFPILKLPQPWSIGVFVFFVLAVAALITRQIVVQHSVEIHPDGMFVDGLFFSIEAIGDNWPNLQMNDDDQDRLVLCGIYGTRFVEYVTANRIGENDRTPEVLAADLESAMEQLWGRREAIVPESTVTGED